MTWAKDTNGNYVNLDQTIALFANQNGLVWNIRGATTDGNTAVDFDGTFASEADTQTAIQRLVDGVDPADY